jgi:hypothetical protein
MKLCKDCNYFRAPIAALSVAKCSHPTSATTTNIVFGYIVWYSCKAMRESTDTTSCGPNAQYYDPISPRV